MDQDIKDFVFMEHFNPKREPDLYLVKPCPFCGSKIYSTIEDKRVCFRCGKTFKEPNGN
jgi:DNA-directed RNA polymerase subunit RPC12/RpoP